MRYKTIALSFLAIASVTKPTSTHAQAPVSLFYEEVISDAGIREIFVRNSPINLYLTGLRKEASELATENVQLYAKAAALPMSMSGKGANLVIIRTGNVSQGNSLNVASLAGFGLPEQIISTMSKTEGWAAGCGGHVFKGRDGSISASVGILDDSLSEELERKCISLLILHSFGVALNKGAVVPNPMNPFKYAFFINVLYECARSAKKPNAVSATQCINEDVANINLQR